MNIPNHRFGRFAPVGLAVVLLSLTAFALAVALATNRAVGRAENASALSDAYEQARYAVGAEQSLEREYRLDPSINVRTSFGQAGKDLVAALRRVAALGGPDDRALSRHLLETHGEYLRVIRRMFAAVEAHDSKRVLGIDQIVDPVFGFVEEKVSEAARAHHGEAADSLSSLDRTENLALIGTPIAFALGLALVAAFAVILRGYRRRIDEATQAELARLEQAALVDSLTGLRNHRAFHEDLARELHRRNRSGSSVALVMIDVEGLKEVNDTQGHQAGDDRLKTVAGCLRSDVRGSDAAYRVGGDEFMVILVGETAWTGFQFVQRLQQKLTARSQGSMAVAAGIGDAADLVGKDVLIHRADRALIEAKKSHRSVLIYSEEMDVQPETTNGEVTLRHRKTLASALARAVDAKDSYTRSHCETVAELCALIAQELALEPERIAQVRLAGLLHDVGKIGIADAILQKPAKLTDEEFEVMKTHSELGFRIMSAAAEPEEARWILHHHERLDGRGYPQGLSNEEIPLESRIMLVADAFEAMTADRPYRKGRPVEDALEELDRCAGTQFDAECVAALQSVLRKDASVLDVAA